MVLFSLDANRKQRVERKGKELQDKTVPERQDTDTSITEGKLLASSLQQSLHLPIYLSPKQGTVLHTCNPSTWIVWTGENQEPRAGLGQGKFKTGLDYMRLFQNEKNQIVFLN